ncbi:MAG: alanine--tRNA ligase [Deltaproteobacteria bacterium]|nr:alanine--tRNA ligase [Deltaproteobacteria bacterium]
MKSSDVRSSFVNYFKRQGHVHLPSSSLIPENDATLLFANAGMNQFKNLFLGLEKKDYRRAVTSQKCVRAGGKHNDLENVGFTARHHTFFEMLGNFSFGDYFKKEAIHFAWEYLTKDLGLDKNKLFVTVFQNDDEAADIWHHQEGVPKDRIFRFGEKDNFWRMGDTGPCGPCSEIFFDRGEEFGKIKDPFKSIESGEDRIIEIWNLVFMQFFEKSPGVMEPLPKPSVDTGAGLERVVSVVQGQWNNFDTDIFQPMIQSACRVSGMDYVTDVKILESHKDILEKTSALRVLADHCRSTGFLIADGALPSNEGRGYVLRRIIRRAIRYGRKLSDKSLLYPMVEALITSMSEAYPELAQRKIHILNTVKDEETRFLQTLDVGSEILENEIKNLKQHGKKKLSGDVLFKLYDTYGFPVDLSRLIAEEKGILSDEAEFEKLAIEAKSKARASWKGKSMDADQAHLIKLTSECLNKNKATVFVGYSQLNIESQIMIMSDGHHQVDKLMAGQSGFVVLDKTSFYAESGGQSGDKGFIAATGLGSGIAGLTSDFKTRVENTVKLNDIFMHSIEVLEGDLQVGAKVIAEVDKQSRNQTAANHSATHLLHAALRKVLGEQVTQAGSLVDDQKLRFDFTYNKPLTFAEIEKVENLVNSAISSSLEVGTHLMSYPQALEFGAMALFGEKYSEQVRVLKMGDFSCELCGGTHVKNTSEIRVFKIVSETGVSSGVRRVEALSGDMGVKYLFKSLNENQKSKQDASIHENWETFLSKSTFELPLWIEARKNEIKELDREIRKLKLNQVDVDQVVSSKFQTQGAVACVVAKVETDDREAIAEIVDRIKNKLQQGIVVVLGAGTVASQQQFPLVVGVSKDLISKIKAGDIVKKLCQKFGGNGGGRPDFAQGSVSSFNDLQLLKNLIAETY